MEFTDQDGGRYSLTLDGSISKEKLLHVFDMMDLIAADDPAAPSSPDDTAFGRISNLVEKSFSIGSFCSSDALEAYEDAYNQPIKLSTVSTYLYRLAERGFLKRQRNGDTWSYRRARPGISR
jgi:hypothetical protein